MSFWASCRTVWTLKTVCIRLICYVNKVMVNNRRHRVPQPFHRRSPVLSELDKPEVSFSLQGNQATSSRLNPKKALEHTSHIASITMRCCIRSCVEMLNLPILMDGLINLPYQSVRDECEGEPLI